MDYITSIREDFAKVVHLDCIPAPTYPQPDNFPSSSWSSWDLLQSGRECVGISGSYTVAINVNIEVILMPSLSQREVISPSLVRNIVSNLLDNRDFLGYQLSYCNGNLTEDQFNIIKGKFLTPHNVYDTSTLADSVFLLMKSTSLIFDSDQISTIFKCDIDIAEKALTEIVNRLNA